MKRYAIIGTGMMGQEHIRNIDLLEGATVAAIAEPDPGMRECAARLLERGSAEIFNDYRELLSAGLCDAYVVATPNDTHHAILSDLVHTGNPILCEKPLCATVEDCRDIISVTKQYQAPIWVAMEYRYMPPVSRLLETLAGGVVGSPQMMTVREHRFPFLDKVGAWNRFSRRTGGTLVEKCCHFWDLMRLVFQCNPVNVYASAAMDVNHLEENYAGNIPDVIDNAFVIVEFSGGQRGMLDLCMFADGSKWQEIIAVTGPNARMEALIPGPLRFSESEHPAGRFIVSDRKSRVESIEEIEVDRLLLGAGDHHGSTYFQHLRFFDLVTGKLKRPDVSLEDGLWSVLVGAAAEQSSQTGQAVQVGL